jgi:hypothetical protein
VDALPEASLPPFNPSAWSGSDSKPGPAISADNAGQVTSLAHWGRGMIFAVEISPDGSRIALNTSTGIGLYETQTMREIHFLEMDIDYRNLGIYDPGMYAQLDFSPDGQVLAVVVESQVHLLDANDGAPLSILEGR